MFEYLLPRTFWAAVFCLCHLTVDCPAATCVPLAQGPVASGESSTAPPGGVLTGGRRKRPKDSSRINEINIPVPPPPPSG